GDQFEEFGEDVDNLRTDVDYVTASHEELADDVAAENDRRELKEDKYDEDLDRLEQGLAENKEKTEELEEKIVDEDTIDDKIETGGKNATNNAIDHVYGDLAAKQEDIEGNNQRLDNDVSNVKDDMEEMRREMNEMREAEQAKRSNRRMSFPP
ncbi:hypothetical protein ACHAWC_000156, partial [Mediolabrus comicus]